MVSRFYLNNTGREFEGYMKLPAVASNFPHFAIRGDDTEDQFLLTELYVAANADCQVSTEYFIKASLFATMNSPDVGGTPYFWYRPIVDENLNPKVPNHFRAGISTTYLGGVQHFITRVRANETSRNLILSPLRCAREDQGIIVSNDTVNTDMTIHFAGYFL